MKLMLRTKFSLYFIIFFAFSFILISVLTNTFAHKYFKEYVKLNEEQAHKSIVSALEHKYAENATWNMELLDIIGANSLERGFIIKVLDEFDNLLWDATIHNEGMCQRIIQQMHYNMNSRYPHIEGYYIEKTYPVYYHSDNVGTVKIGSYGPFYMSEYDLAFLDTLNRIIFLVGSFSLLCALFFGSVMARRLTNPISKVIDNAQLISKGDFSARIHEESSTLEICQLTDTINNLAKSLEKQEILKKRLTSDVAHELRTPLATLQSHMEALIDGIWEPEIERLKSCHEEIVRISKIVEILGQLAKYESENLSLSKTTFDIFGQIQNLLKHFESDFINNKLNCKLSGTKTLIHADKDKITQVAINLISNAIKYTNEGGEIQISIDNFENTVKFTVRDTGIGISQEDLPHIFERFYRADKSRNRMTGGSGIGLTISKAIIDSHNGKIEVKSTLGEGSEFTVHIPHKEVSNISGDY